VANLVFCLWWVAGMSSPMILNRPELKIVFSAALHHFFWGFFIITLLNIALSAVNLVRPYWTTRRAVFRLVTDGLGSALFCWLLKAGIVMEIAPNVSPERVLEVTNAVNQWIARAFPVAVLVAVVIAGGNIYRIFRVRSRRTRFSPGVATAVV
jgi:hypothetical protein